MEDDEGNTICAVCEKDMSEEEEFECAECEETVCENCTIAELETVVLCSECLKKCPVETIEVEKIVEKIIEVPKEVVKVMGFSEPIL